MAKRPGPKGKKSKNRMGSAEVEATNAAHEAEQAAMQTKGGEPIVGPNVQVGEFIDRVSLAPEPDLGITESDDGELEVAHAEQPEMTSEQAAEHSAVEAALGEGAEEEKIPNSVVKDKFKKSYIDNAKLIGATGKAARRSNWDWLAQTIAEQCLVEKEKIDIGRFTDLLDANGVDHSRWTNRNKGWEGRFRMTGRVALQKIVATNGVLKTMTGEVVPPADWVAKYKAKV